MLNKPKTLLVMEGSEDQIRFTYSDAYGIKKSNWIPDHLSYLFIRQLKRFKFNINSIEKRIEHFEIFLTSENILQRESILIESIQ